MINIHQFFEIIGASIVLTGGFIVIYAGLYDFCKFVDKVKARKAKQKQLNKQRKDIFQNVA